MRKKFPSNAIHSRHFRHNRDLLTLIGGRFGGLFQVKPAKSARSSVAPLALQYAREKFSTFR